MNIQAAKAGGTTFVLTSPLQDGVADTEGGAAVVSHSVGLPEGHLWQVASILWDNRPVGDLQCEVLQPLLCISVAALFQSGFVNTKSYFDSLEAVRKQAGAYRTTCATGTCVSAL